MHALKIQYFKTYISAFVYTIYTQTAFLKYVVSYKKQPFTEF